MTRIVGHLRSNAVAYLALFVALGGTSYAAVAIPAGSVGAKQIRNGAITPVKMNSAYTNGTVRAWAIVSAAGKVLGGAGKPSARLTAVTPGTYIVDWAVPISTRCAPLATVSGDLSTPTETVTVPGGSATLAAGYAVAQTPSPEKLGGGVPVTTFDQSGAPTPLAFYIAVVC